MVCGLFRVLNPSGRGFALIPALAAVALSAAPAASASAATVVLPRMPGCWRGSGCLPAQLPLDAWSYPC